MKISLPGKTFLVGEYLALSGGPSLLLCTEPRFSLTVRRTEPGEEARLPFPAGSPAARLAAQARETIMGHEFEFEDPHAGRGGLGASSAQFALLLAAIRKLSSGSLPQGWDWSELLYLYRACAWDGQGRAPSGADVVAQLTGGVTYFDGRSQTAESLEWSSEELGFTLVRTGHKLATHEHLRAASEIREESLRPLVGEAKTALQGRDDKRLAEIVQAYGDALASQGFLSEATAELIEAIRAEERRSGFGLRAVKGCGAMGADVVLLLHERAARVRLVMWLGARGLVICGDERDLGVGLRLEAERLETGPRG